MKYHNVKGEVMKCDECGREIVDESRQSVMVDGNFCSDHCQDMAERIAA